MHTKKKGEKNQIHDFGESPSYRIDKSEILSYVFSRGMLVLGREMEEEVESTFRFSAVAAHQLRRFWPVNKLKGQCLP